MSAYVAIIISALINGIFVGFFIKTGIDASPTGIGLKVIETLEPLIQPRLENQVSFMKYMIIILPWIVTIIGILKAPNKIAGLILYIAVFVISTIIISLV